MGYVILALLIGVPIAEIAVFIEAGEIWGLWPTLGAIVATAVVGGDFAGSPEGSCIAKTVKQAQFPQFSKPAFKFTYPVQL